MKPKIGQNLERIIDFIKNTGNFVKDHPREVIMIVGLGTGAYAFDKLTPKAYAAQIRASNVSWSGGPKYDYASDPDLLMITGENFF